MVPKLNVRTRHGASWPAERLLASLKGLRHVVRKKIYPSKGGPCQSENLRIEIHGWLPGIDRKMTECLAHPWLTIHDTAIIFHQQMHRTGICLEGMAFEVQQWYWITESWMTISDRNVLCKPASTSWSHIQSSSSITSFTIPYVNYSSKAHPEQLGNSKFPPSP